MPSLKRLLSTNQIFRLRLKVRIRVVLMEVNPPPEVSNAFITDSVSCHLVCVKLRDDLLFVGMDMADMTSAPGAMLSAVQVGGATHPSPGLSLPSHLSLLTLQVPRPPQMLLGPKDLDLLLQVWREYGQVHAFNALNESPFLS